MALKKSKVHKILVFTLSNIGDVILTFPVIDILRHDFPEAELHVMVGPRAEGLFKSNTLLQKVIVYDKHDKRVSKFQWMMDLRRENYDLVVDLKNSALPFFLGPRYRTSFIVKKKENEHMRAKHLRHLRSVYKYENESPEQSALTKTSFRLEAETYCVMAPGSANEYKRWSPQGFATVADCLFQEHELQTVFIGGEEDQLITDYILKLMKHKGINMCAQTSLAQSAAVIDNCMFALVNDSAPMHLASYLNRPTLALFGGVSFPEKYGPWSKQSLYLFKERITDITAEDVLQHIQIKDHHATFI